MLAIVEWFFSLFEKSIFQGIFFLMAVVGGAFSAFTLVFGGDMDVDADVDLDGDIDMDADGPSWLGLRGIMLLMTGFGGGGFAVYHFTEKILFSSIGGIFTAILIWLPCMVVYRFLWRSQHTATVKLDAFLGSRGRVTTPIPSSGVGQVHVSVEGHGIYRSAQTEDNSPLSMGTQIEVVSVVGSVVFVRQSS